TSPTTNRVQAIGEATEAIPQRPRSPAARPTIRNVNASDIIRTPSRTSRWFARKGLGPSDQDPGKPGPPSEAATRRRSRSLSGQVACRPAHANLGVHGSQKWDGYAPWTPLGPVTVSPRRHRDDAGPGWMPGARVVGRRSAWRPRAPETDVQLLGGLRPKGVGASLL